MAWQVALPPVPTSVHGDVVNAPAPLLVNVTVPVGVLDVPGDESATVAVQLLV